MNFRDRAVMFCATGGGIGYAPIAPGTFGSFAGLLICFGLSRFSVWTALGLTVALILFAIWIAHEAEKALKQKDPGRIIIDEIAGMAVTLIGIPFTITNAAMAFILFRVYDIAKPFPIRLVDRKVPGGLGVVLDDVVAGVFGNLSLRLLLFIYTRLG